jgi:hypothetical protein
LEQPRCSTTDEWIKKMWYTFVNATMYPHPAQQEKKKENVVYIHSGVLFRHKEE